MLITHVHGHKLDNKTQAKSSTLATSLVASFASLLTPLLLAGSTLLASTGAQAQTGNEAMALLNRMRLALHQLNYNGTLVYRRDDSLSTLRIEHSVVNGIERERVVRLNEQGSEISRELKGFSLASIPVIRPQMEKVYSFDWGRENRVANIPCRIITARPKDRVRYLQKYCIDTKSGLLLDYMLVGKTHKPVEQFMFTSIKYSRPQDEALEPGSSGKSRHKNHTDGTTPDDVILESLPLDVEMKLKATAPELLGEMPIPKVKVVKAKSTTIKLQAAPQRRQISASQLDDGWVMEPLPAGFEISKVPPVKPATDHGAPTEHYIITDGLSSLSVFVSPLSSASQQGLVSKQGVQLNSGALNVISRKKDNYMITVVGEVPESTLKSVIDSLRRTMKGNTP